MVERRIEIPGQSPEEDRLLAMVTALASELAVVRERLDTVERLAEAAGVFQRGAIEHYVPDVAATAERDTLRRRIIDRVFRSLREAAARTSRGEPS